MRVAAVLVVLALLAGCGPRVAARGGGGGGDWSAATPLEPASSASSSSSGGPSSSSGEATPIPALKITPLDEKATGFDLSVTPNRVVAWKLDDELRTEPLPARIRGLAPGMHTIEIEPPAGYLGRIDSFRFARDQAIKIEMVLMPTSTSAVVPVEPPPP